MKLLLFIGLFWVSFSSFAGLSQEMTKRHIVFVGVSDFLTWAKGFKDNLEGVKRLNPNAETSIVNSRFFESYEKNAVLLHQEFLKAYKAGGSRPLIIFGNPQTGPYSLYTLLVYPKLLTDGVVEKLILLAPAFGSPLADIVENKFQRQKTRILFNKK